MNKQAPTFGRIAAMVGFALTCFGLLLYLWLAFGGPAPLKPKGYRIDVPFNEAAYLGVQADVRVSGVRIGQVKTLRRAPGGNQTLATLEIERRYAPISRDARATLRRKTLLGETYVELTFGSEDAPKVPEGGLLPVRNVEESVELDEILNTFDPITRDAYRTWQRELGAAIDERGGDLNDAIGNLPGFVDAGGDLFEVLDQEKRSLQQLVKNTGVVFGALTEREQQLRRLVENQDTVFTAIQRQKEDFADVFQVLPTFLRESRQTYRRLGSFSDKARPVVGELEPAMRDLAATLESLGAASPDLQRFFTAYGPLLDASREGLPATAQTLRAARPFLAELGPWLGQVNPILGWLGEHSHTISDILGNLGVSTAARTESADPQATGHYLRQYGPAGVETLAVQPNRLSTNRGNAYINPLGLIDPAYGRQHVIASFDCNNDRVKEVDGSTPACREAGPYKVRSSELSKFPRIGAETYPGR
jgi:phospholipid/cholesterol/gamma-HCH transport system substrate-binding protein